MSLHIEFEPHSWYMGFAVQKKGNDHCEYIYDGRDTDGMRWQQCIVHDCLAPSEYAPCAEWERISWYGVTANGMTGYLVEFEADTRSDLKKKIKEWRARK